MDKIKVQERKEELIKLTSEFCRVHLDEEYRQLCEKLIGKMARKRQVPFLAGRLEIWAAAIVHALGTINFLFDKSSKPFFTVDGICAYFNTSKSTTAQKSKLIRDMFKMGYFDSEFSTHENAGNNPMANLVSVNGLLIPKNMLPELLGKKLI
ncbi:MAG: DUF6398 domain-containing protein [Clostridia bacterium]|nr:DUF6398 domain-containing protein [Clostridia bacterium]